MKIAVVKAGGSVLNSSKEYLRLADALKELRSNGYAIVLVVSAMKGFTDWLIKIGSEVSFHNPDPALFDDLLSMGERVSAKIMAMALKAVGLRAIALDPLNEKWPIITDENHGNAHPLIGDIQKKVNEHIKDLLLKGITVVIPGFIGVSKYSGKITTLGRNSSDITAAILAKCLNADVLIYLKDTGGILRLPPSLGNAQDTLKTISSVDLKLLAHHGAKVMHPLALEYLDSHIRVIFSSVDELPKLKGTEVLFTDNPRLDIERGLCLATFVNVKDYDTLFTRITKELAQKEVKIIDVLMRKSSLSLLVKGAFDTSILVKYLRAKFADAAHVKKGLALIRVTLSQPKLKLLSYLYKEPDIYEIMILRDEVKLVVSEESIKFILERLKLVKGDYNGQA